MTNWKKYKLGELATKITKGTTPSTVGGKFLNSGINYIKSEAIDYEGRIDTSTFVFIDDKTHEKLKRSQLEEYDILFSMAGIFLGKTGLVTKAMLPANTNQAVAIIRLNKSLANPKFIHLFLRNPETVRFVNSMSSQSAQPNINLEEVGSLEVNLPALAEQQAIAEILSSLDDKIELNLQTNKTLEEMANALYKHWFVDFGPFQNSKFHKSELGMIPVGWEVKKLEDVLEIKYGKAHAHLEAGEIPVYGSGGVMRYVNKALYEYESILIPRKGTLSNLFYMTEPFWSVDTMFYTIFKQINIGKYMFSVLRNHNLAAMNVGSAVPSLTTEVLNRIRIIVPSSSVLDRFDPMAASYLSSIKQNIKENKSLSSFRDYLLPKLISGEIRVKEELKKMKATI